MIYRAAQRILLCSVLLGVPAMGQQSPPAANTPQVLDVQGGKIRVVTVANGLKHPWSLAFLPDGRTLLVTEQNGRLRIFRDRVLDPTPVWTSPT